MRFPVMDAPPDNNGPPLRLLKDFGVLLFLILALGAASYMDGSLAGAVAHNRSGQLFWAGRDSDTISPADPLPGIVALGTVGTPEPRPLSGTELIENPVTPVIPSRPQDLPANVQPDIGSF